MFFPIAQLTLSSLSLLLIAFLIWRSRMSVTAQQAQQDLDTLTAAVVQLLPAVALTLNNQSTLIAQLRAGQTPSMDPDKVEADVQAIQAQLAALSTANQNAVVGDPPPPAPAAP